MSILLAALGKSISILAESEALCIRSENADVHIANPSSWPHDAISADSGGAIAIEIGQLLEQGLGEESGRNVNIPYEFFSTARNLGFTLTTRWTKWSPFLLAISPSGDVGRRDFRYRYRFLLGAMEVLLERAGVFVQRVGRPSVFHLDDQTYALLEAMDRFNQLPADRKTEKENWLAFSVVKGCSREVGAALDLLLQSNDVAVPSRIALRIYQHDDGSISFVPRCDGVPEAELRNAFFAHPSVEGVYSMDLPTGGRLRVIFDDEQQEVLRRMKLVQRIQGDAKRTAIHQPGRFFEGVLDRIDLPYGRRVIGIGAFPFESVPHGPAMRWGVFDGEERNVPDEHPSQRETDDLEKLPDEDARPSSITCKMADDDSQKVLEFPDAEARQRFQEKVRAALARGQTTLVYEEARVRIDDELARVLLMAPTSKRKGGDRPTNEHKAGKYLLIYTDEVDLRPWDEDAVQKAISSDAGSAQFVRPRSLRDDVVLKKHQEEGVAWLQTCSRLRTSGRRGALLADDMGVGKTLQVLSYLAWAIENGHITEGESDRTAPPWRPILIIAPLILVEDGTWEKEIERFFKNTGSVFYPICSLRGRALEQFKKTGRAGQDTVIGEPTLDPAKLQQYRLIITNYETVKNYQHSFAQTIDGVPLWSIVVTDEAQEYKTPNTKVSHALKALQPDFHVASTGTPVENRLLDIWNLFDTLQPALLGTANEFCRTYEVPLRSSSAKEVLPSLKERLLYGRSSAFLIRREKAHVIELPKKSEIRLSCDLSEKEVETHLSLIAGLSEHRKQGGHLAVLHRLAQLYQHRALLADDWSQNEIENLILDSAKLRVVIKELHKIAIRREKVLIFARLVAVQQMLALALSREFDLSVKIINGATAKGPALKSSASTRSAKETRSRILAEFREKPGFNILILSPFVAGVGLTITEANHVFHYGRWWNPAVESQATDRVYRIGQEREVFVYYPIFHDRSGRVGRSFDECLDQLLQDKSLIAKDFLRPVDAEDAIADELCNSLIDSRSPEDQSKRTLLSRDEINRLSPLDFEALVACAYEGRGYRCVLTCQANDAGADVVAIKGREAWLIQVKHSHAQYRIAPEAIDDVMASQMAYQNATLNQFRLAVVSNSQYSAECIERSHRDGVALIDGRALESMCKEAAVTLGQIVARASQRARSFHEGIEKIRSLFT